MAQSGTRHSRFSNHRRHFHVYDPPPTSYPSTDRGLVAVPDLLAMIKAGEITDNESLGALLVALVHLDRVH